MARLSLQTNAASPCRPSKLPLPRGQYNWWFRGLFCLLLFAYSGCDNTVTVRLSLSQSCPIPKEIKDHLAKKPESKLLGCLVAFWQSQPLTTSYSQPVSISPQGTAAVVQRGETSGIRLPPSALDHPLLFRMYVIFPAKAEGLVNDIDGHELLCRSMSAADYNCLDKLNDCWITFELQPDVTYQGKLLKAVAVTDTESNRCKVCVPERCDDGIDNDCNGKIDDIDAINKVPCPKK